MIAEQLISKKKSNQKYKNKMLVVEGICISGTHKLTHIKYFRSEEFQDEKFQALKSMAIF